MTPFILPGDTEEQGILFFYEGVEQCLSDESLYADWLQQAAITERKKIGLIRVIFMSDENLLELNRTYLGHDDYTDIITFPLDEDPIEAELYISIDRVKDNAAAMDVHTDEELARVMVHGLLHLCGYGDKSDAEKRVMRTMENKYLERLKR